MIKRKFISMVVFIVLLITCLSGCAKVVKTEIIVVDATVVDVYYKGVWMQPIWVGKKFIYIFHPAQYNVTLQYEDYKTTVDNLDLYNKYKDNIGGQVECNLVTTYYDDGTIKTTLELGGNVNE